MTNYEIIDQAYEQGKTDGFNEMEKACEVAYAKGRLEAFEEAANVCDVINDTKWNDAVHCSCLSEAAIAIRQLKEVKQ